MRLPQFLSSLLTLGRRHVNPFRDSSVLKLLTVCLLHNQKMLQIQSTYRKFEIVLDELIPHVGEGSLEEARRTQH